MPSSARSRRTSPRASITRRPFGAARAGRSAILGRIPRLPEPQEGAMANTQEPNEEPPDEIPELEPARAAAAERARQLVARLGVEVVIHAASDVLTETVKDT